MTDTERKFIKRDPEGNPEFDQLVIYTSRNCRCSTNCCYEDTLSLYDDMDEEKSAYNLTIEGSDMKHFIEYLIERTLEEIKP